MHKNISRVTCELSMLVLTLSFFFTANSYAQYGAYISNVTYNGSGCPLGSASIALSPQKSSVSVLFDSFAIESAVQKPRRGAGINQYRNCMLAMKLNIPYGMQARIANVDVRGYVSLSHGMKASASMILRALPAGIRNPRIAAISIIGRENIQFPSPMDDVYNLSYSGGENSRWTKCGIKVIDVLIQISGHIRGIPGNKSDVGILTFDSADAATEAALNYQLEWQPCR